MRLLGLLALPLAVPWTPWNSLQAASRLSHGLNRAVRKLSLPEGLLERISIGFPGVLECFWGSLASPWPHDPLGPPWEPLGLETNKELPQPSLRKTLF